MTNQKSNHSTSAGRLPITPQRIASIRVWNDLLILIVSAIFLSSSLENTTSWFILAGSFGMLAASLIGYYLIQQGRTITGMGFVIYGLLFGMTTISAFVEKLGPFSLVAMVLVTTLSVSYAIPVRRVIEAVSASLVFGIFSLLLDLNFRGAEFRLSAPPQLTTLLWIITLILVIIIFYLIARQFQFFTMRAKMITSFAAITILALSILGFFNSRSVRNVLSEEANQSLFNAAAQTEDSLRQFIDTNFQSIKTEAKLPILVDYLSSTGEERENLAPQAMATLNALAQKDPTYIASYALLDLQGNVLADTQAAHISENEALLSAIIEASQQGKTVLSPVEIDPFTTQPSLYFSTPVYENEVQVGILRIRYHAEILQNIITKSNNRGGENSFAVLFDENLIHLAHGIAPETIFQSVIPLDNLTFEKLIEERRLPFQSPQETFLDLPDLETNLRAAQNATEGVVYFEATDVATGERINQVVALNLVEPAWLLVFFQPQEIYLAPIESLANNTILLGLLSGLGAVICGVWLTQILTTPIMNLTQTAEKISQGDFSTKVEITTQDEIGQLGKTFNNMTYQLQNMVTNLESQVDMRTKSLRNQASQLRASAEVARDITTVQTLQDLLDRATNLICERFGYYHVGIYLNDPQNDYSILASSLDQPGQRLLQANHRFKINPDSNVGYASILGEPILASVSGQNQTTPMSFHPLLPNSQAQLVLPLKQGKQILGALDIHSTNPTSFSEDDKQIFQILADQIAIAIQKARYQEEIQKALDELEAAYGIFTRESWQKFIQTRQTISGYRFNQRKVEFVETPSPEVLEAWQIGNQVIAQKKASHPKEQDTSILAIPMKVRGEVIGVLNIEFETSQIPADTTALISEIAERLGLILENARLIDTAKKQVEREQLTSHISNSIRQSLDMDVVLRTAVQEIGQSLGLSEVELRLGSPDSVRTSSQSKSNGNQDSESVRN